jgi:hypothetical protein
LCTRRHMVAVAASGETHGWITGGHPRRSLLGF